MAATPRYFTKAQEAAESGGKQFGRDGSVLIGRRSNGQLPKPVERAYGVGQIQVGTARETAARHGIPWDESKLMNEAEYNLTLANLHKGDLLAHYKGDETLATAAYHSGQGGVDRAVRIHGRANFTQGLGPDGKDYVLKSGDGLEILTK